MDFVRVEVIGELPIVSVLEYREEDEVVWDGNKPLLDGNGDVVTQKVKVPVTQDVSRGGFAFLDPEVTNIRALVRAGLVKIAPEKKAAK